MPGSFDDHIQRRATHERLRRESRTRIASVPGAHGALYTSLRTGVLQVGDQLDESRLVPMFTFSRNAVRDALRLLADAGVVSRQPRRGTVVVAMSTQVPLDVALGWAETVDRRREVVVTDRRWTASTPVTRRYLRCTQDTVHVTEAIDMCDGVPSMLHTRFTIDGDQRPLVASPASDGYFRDLFEKTYGASLAAIDCWVEATGADEWASTRLAVPVGTLLLVKSRVLYSADGLPREYSVSHYLATEATFSASVDNTDAPVGAPVAGTGCRSGSPAGPRGRTRSSTDLHTQLRAAIREGLYRNGDRFGEGELAEDFGASRNAVRRAIAQLAAEGIVTRNRRHGTVLTGTVTEYNLNDGMVYHPEQLSRYRAEQRESRLIPTPPFIAELLQTRSGSIRLDEYLICKDEKPTTLYIRYSAADIDQRPLTCASGQDFQALFTRSYGSPTGQIAHNVHAVRAGDQIARRLGVSPETGVLLAERVICDRQGRPREFSHSYHLAADVSLAIHHDLGSRPIRLRRTEKLSAAEPDRVEGDLAC